MDQTSFSIRSFLPYGLAALLIGLVGGFSSMLGPAFVQELGLDYSCTTWTALAQAISTAAFSPILGRIGDSSGRRRTLLVGMAVFTLGNLLSALANTLGFMLLARFAVGLGTAAMAPVIVACIVAEFPPEQTGRGFSLYMLISSISVVFGPTLGSWVLTLWGWRTMMGLCTALCLAVLGACLLLCRRGEGQLRQPLQLDIPGSVMMVLFFGLLLCIPAVGQTIGWTSGMFFAVLAAAAVSLTVLVLIERRAAQPILSGSFLTRRVFVLSVLSLLLTQGLMQANMTNSIIFLDYTKPGGSPVSGYVVSILYLGMSLGAALLGPLADRWEPRSVLTGSLLLTAGGCGLLLAASGGSVVLLAAALGLLGLGLGGNGTILMKAALSGLSPQEAGAGAGTYGLFRDLTAPFGVAVLVPLFNNEIGHRMAVGRLPEAAAAEAMGLLAMVELLCVAAAIVIVRFLPRIHARGKERDL